VSRTVYSDAQIKLVLFGFDAGQSLSEHTASQPAIIQILQGDAAITLGNDAKEASAGTWIHMPANLPHSVVAKTRLIMLLTLLKNQVS
jgi:quercetin dioxygenase-like cupin family protein